MTEESSRVPVFTSTSEVEFAVTERSPRQVVTLYNPYGYPIQYKVLCTAPTNYSVGEYMGNLNAKCCKDIVVRCTTRLSVGCVDKLRIEIRKKGSSEIHGVRDLTLRTVAERSSPSQDSTRPPFFGMGGDSMTSSSGPRGRNESGGSRGGGTQADSSQWGFLLAGLACACALALPTIADPSAQSSSIPAYLHLSQPQKLVAAYILGIVSVLILRPT